MGIRDQTVDRYEIECKDVEIRHEDTDDAEIECEDTEDAERSNTTTQRSVRRP